ncbi:MAG: hypothetical protein K6347_01335 [Campylobacterales bacterium]
MALHPDLFLAWSQSPPLLGLAEVLKNAKIPVVLTDQQTIEDEAKTLRFLGMLLNRKARAEKLAQELEKTDRED